MKQYICEVPYMNSLGSISPFSVDSSSTQTKEEYALWVLNKMREHDGLQPMSLLPSGTKFYSVGDAVPNAKEAVAKQLLHEANMSYVKQKQLEMWFLK